MKMDTCHLPLQGWSQWPLKSLTNLPWNKFEVESKNEVLTLCENWRNRSQINTSGEDFMSPISYILYVESTKIMNNDIWLLMTSSNLLPKCVVSWTSSPKSHIAWTSTPLLGGCILRDVGDAGCLAKVLILHPNKTLIHNSQVMLFFFQLTHQKLDLV